MNFLDKLTHEHRDMLASLPYRVGFWISQSDDAGGEDSDEQEARVLANILDGFAHEVFGAEMVQHIMVDTVTHKERWNQWGEDIGNIPEDCQRAIEILTTYGDEKDVAAFSLRLVEIAEAVAMAFSEIEFTSTTEKIKMYVRYYAESIKANMRKERYKSLHEFLSISGSERAVLKELSEALGLKYT